MKRIFLLLLGLFLCACGRYGCGVPAEYEQIGRASCRERV